MTHSHMPDCHKCSYRENSAFRCLEAETLDILNQGKSFQIFQKGEMLFHAGDAADRFFCIMTGTVRTFRTLAETGKEQTFKIKSSGDWIGCRDTILSGRYNHSAVCISDVEACVVPRKLLSALQADSLFQQELLEQIARFYRESENHLYSLGTKQTHAKLAEFLLNLYESNHHEKQIHIDITREVMASIIGTTTESVIRALSDFKARGWIQLDKSKVIFLNLSALKGMSQIENELIAY